MSFMYFQKPKMKVALVIFVVIYLCSAAKPSQEQTTNKITQLVNFIDINADKFVTYDELQSKMFMLDVDGDGSLTHMDLRILLVDDHKLMPDALFKDFWWIISRGWESDEQTVGKDYSKILFNFMDRDGDNQVTLNDFVWLVQTGGREKETPHSPSPYDSIVNKLDSDGSVGLSQDELWKPLLSLIREAMNKGYTGLPTNLLSETLQKYLPLSSMDCSRLTMCLDRNDDSLLKDDEQTDMVTPFDVNGNNEVESFELHYGMQKIIDECIDDYVKRLPELTKDRKERLQKKKGRDQASLGKQTLDENTPKSDKSLPSEAKENKEHKTQEMSDDDDDIEVTVEAMHDEL